MLPKNPSENEDPIWTTHMLTLTKRKRSMEIAQTIDNALKEYYSEKGMTVPQWKQRKDPLWWREYLIRLGIDPENP